MTNWKAKFILSVLLVALIPIFNHVGFSSACLWPDGTCTHSSSSLCTANDGTVVACCLGDTSLYTDSYGCSCTRTCINNQWSTCTPQEHRACVNGQCEIVCGQGSDQCGPGICQCDCTPTCNRPDDCRTNSDCSPGYECKSHTYTAKCYTCSGEKTKSCTYKYCTKVNECDNGETRPCQKYDCTGTQTCTNGVWGECQIQQHRECVNGQCKLVCGQGSDQCGPGICQCDCTPTCDRSDQCTSGSCPSGEVCVTKNYVASCKTCSGTKTKNCQYKVCQPETCDCSEWKAGACGGGSCSDNQRLYTRTCSPNGCGQTSKCEVDSNCCTEWKNEGCGKGICSSNEMKQTRLCGGETESRCVYDDSCSASTGTECKNSGGFCTPVDPEPSRCYINLGQKDCPRSQNCYKPAPMNCGDGVCCPESGETQDNCCQDCGCPAGETCLSTGCSSDCVTGCATAGPGECSSKSNFWQCECTGQGCGGDPSAYEECHGVENPNCCTNGYFSCYKYTREKKCVVSPNCCYNLDDPECNPTCSGTCYSFECPEGYYQISGSCGASGEVCCACDMSNCGEEGQQCCACGCKSGLTCVGGICKSSCAKEGESCSSSDDCCEGLICRNNICSAEEQHFCGDGNCDSGETNCNCPRDCGEKVCDAGKPRTVECGKCGRGTRTDTCKDDCSGWIEGTCDDPDKNAECCPNDPENNKETAPCGRCNSGTKTRTCNSDGTWSEWSECTGETGCIPGKTETESCGNCGTKTRTCNDKCQWGEWGPCENEGVCSPGSTEVCTCPDGSTGTKLCSDECQWGECDCSVCTPGETRSCTLYGCSGTQTCNSNGRWGECVVPRHKECSGNSCVSVCGSGTDECSDNSDCITCSCGAWNDVGCGQGLCNSNEMYQTRVCSPAGCLSESRCIYDTSCLSQLSIEVEKPSNGEVFNFNYATPIKWTVNGDAQFDHFVLKYKCSGDDSWTIIDECVDKNSREYHWVTPGEPKYNCVVRVEAETDECSSSPSPGGCGNSQIEQGEICDPPGSSCDPHLEDDVCYYGGICSSDCSNCQNEKSEYCPVPGTVKNGICYYGTTINRCGADGCQLNTCSLGLGETCSAINGCTGRLPFIIP